MKNLILLFIITIAFASCENRRTQSQALSESIEEFKKTVNFESNVFIPENYIEREVDTLMSNGYRVKIKTYSDMTNTVLFSKIKDTINYQTHYRNFKFDIRVEKQGQLIYEESFDKDKANKLFGYRDDFITESPLHNFNKLAVLQSIQVDDEPTLKNKVLIDVRYTIPETNRFALHTLYVNDNGTINMVHATQN
ncbi:hypothetical protein [uncultured Winogradskyella sp.]|uniref:hypothetical protein n=1 Tax=uncultured Winogradskyella sp. TaxID=395353 RepID=UPI0026319BDB|nr:hypothetical protein [uncultured Winogradskyella sp.]